MDARVDASGDDAADPDSGRDAHVEDARIEDALVDDATIDSGDGSVECLDRPFPLFGDDFKWGDATWVPLDVYCNGRCRTSLASFMQDFTCYDLADDGGVQGIAEDAGGEIHSGLYWWARREGCGSVVFHTLEGSWPRYYNFDESSGELLGAANLDDITSELSGTSCVDAAFIGGTVAAPCADEAVAYCELNR